MSCSCTMGCTPLCTYTMMYRLFQARESIVVVTKWYCFIINLNLYLTINWYLKLNKATGLDKVSVRLLKDSMDIITPSLTYLLNMSIESSVFPCTWENAKVCALSKSGNRSDPSCYRPISILPTISKILEIAIHHQSIKDNNLLSDKQFDSYLNKRKTPNWCDTLASWTGVLVQERRASNSFFFQLNQTYFSKDV